MAQENIERLLESLFGRYIKEFDEGDFRYYEGLLRRKLLNRLENIGMESNGIKKVLAAFDIAAYIHRGDERRLGQIYLEHPVDVEIYTIDKAKELRQQGKLDAPLRPIHLAKILDHDTLESLISDKRKFEREVSFEEGLELIGRAYGEVTQSTEQEVGELKRALETITKKKGEDYLIYLYRAHQLPVNEFIELEEVKVPDRMRNTWDRWSNGDRNTHSKEELSPQRRSVSIFKNILLKQVVEEYMEKNYREIVTLPSYVLLRSELVDLANSTVGESENLTSLITTAINRVPNVERAKKMHSVFGAIRTEIHEYEKTDSFNSVRSPYDQSIFDGNILYYLQLTRKMWGITPEKISKGTTGINYLLDKYLGVKKADIENKFINFLGNYGIDVSRREIPTIRFFSILILFATLGLYQLKDERFRIQGLNGEVPLAPNHVKSVYV